MSQIKKKICLKFKWVATFKFKFNWIFLINFFFEIFMTEVKLILQKKIDEINFKSPSIFSIDNGKDSHL